MPRRPKRRTPVSAAVDRAPAAVYKLELDMVLLFVPPMKDDWPGIRLTRTLELPFAPTSEMQLTGFALNGVYDPMGCTLKEVTWDLDRQVFLAETHLTNVDFPLADVADELWAWVDRGWKLGSYADAYTNDDEEPPDNQEARETIETPSYEERERWPMLPPRKRSASFNKLLQALVREMAKLHNNPSVAYAIHKTKQFFTEEELKERDTKAKQRYFDAIDEYERMSFDAQWDWREHVIRQLPRLDRIVNQPDPGDG